MSPYYYLPTFLYIVLIKVTDLEKWIYAHHEFMANKEKMSSISAECLEIVSTGALLTKCLRLGRFCSLDQEESA